MKIPILIKNVDVFGEDSTTLDILPYRYSKTNNSVNISCIISHLMGKPVTNYTVAIFDLETKLITQSRRLTTANLNIVGDEIVSMLNGEQNFDEIF
jgi:hypothetical protein